MAGLGLRQALTAAPPAPSQNQTTYVANLGRRVATTPYLENEAFRGAEPSPNRLVLRPLLAADPFNELICLGEIACHLRPLMDSLIQILFCRRQQALAARESATK